eukprot:Blabericola_migrator_1__13269@NODE_926_length_6015_cov_19_015804_g644_i0_p1_GENE_NODE_926_length_6015_cov_19_015804_g644_i0NODE_926_length_6015_cov_19_015804_g644_i0_p1_ORF_typecomplete_len1735_score251_40Gryzunlike/PF12742_7/0_032TRAPPC10/PF12584_8/0_17TAS2R/PF05296_13/5_1e03TAS2R/PF05296_13/0_51TAS2R/PF05296_13/2_2e02_NODE_926_length_6015_cov_19_015804_g644_i08105678
MTQLPGCIVLCFDWRTYPLYGSNEDGPIAASKEEVRLALQHSALEWIQRVREEIFKHRVPRRFRRITNENISRLYVQPTPKILPLIILPAAAETAGEAGGYKKYAMRYLDCFNAIMSKHKNDFTSFFVLCGLPTASHQRIETLDDTARRSAMEWLQEKERRYQRLISALPSHQPVTFSLPNLLGSQPLPWLEALTAQSASQSHLLSRMSQNYVTLFSATILRIRWMLKIAYCQVLQSLFTEALKTYRQVFEILKSFPPPPAQAAPPAEQATIKTLYEHHTQMGPFGLGFAGHGLERMGIALLIGAHMLPVCTRLTNGTMDFQNAFERAKNFAKAVPFANEAFRVIQCSALAQFHRFGAKLLTAHKFQDAVDAWWDPSYHLEASLLYLCECRSLLSHAWWTKSPENKSYAFGNPKFVGHLPFAITDEIETFCDIRLRLGSVQKCTSEVQIPAPFPLTATAFSAGNVLNMIIAVTTHICQRRLQSTRLMPSSMILTTLRTVDQLFYSQQWALAFKYYVLLTCPLMYDMRKELRPIHNQCEDLVCPSLSLRLDRAGHDTQWLVTLPPLNFDEVSPPTSSRTFGEFYLHQMLGFAQYQLPKTLEINGKPSPVPHREFPSLGFRAHCRALYCLLRTCNIEGQEVLVKLAKPRPDELMVIQPAQLSGNSLRVLLDAVLRVHLLPLTHRAADLSREFVNKMLLFMTSDPQFSSGFLVPQNGSTESPAAVQVASATVMANPDPHAALWIGWYLISTLSFQIETQKSLRKSWHLGPRIVDTKSFDTELRNVYKSLVEVLVPQVIPRLSVPSVLPPVTGLSVAKCAIAPVSNGFSVWLKTSLPPVLAPSNLSGVVCLIDDECVAVKDFDKIVPPSPTPSPANSVRVSERDHEEPSLTVKFELPASDIRLPKSNVHSLSQVHLLFNMATLIRCAIQISAFEPVLKGPEDRFAASPFVPALETRHPGSSKPRTYSRLFFRSPVSHNVSPCDSFKPRISNHQSLVSLFIREPGRADLSSSIAWLPVSENAFLITPNKFPASIGIRVRVMRKFLSRLSQDLQTDITCGTSNPASLLQGGSPDGPGSKVQSIAVHPLGLNGDSFQPTFAPMDISSIIMATMKALMGTETDPSVTVASLDSEGRLVRYREKTRIPVMSRLTIATATKNDHVSALAVVEMENDFEIGICWYCDVQLVYTERVQVNLVLRNSFDVLDSCSTDFLKTIPLFTASITSVSAPNIPHTKTKPLTLNELRFSLHPTREGVKGALRSCYLATHEAPANVFEFSLVPRKLVPDRTPDGTAPFGLRLPDLETLIITPPTPLVTSVTTGPLQKEFKLERFFETLLEFKNDKDYFCNFGRQMIDHILAEELRVVQRRMETSNPFYIFAEIAVDLGTTKRPGPIRHSETGAVIFPTIGICAPVRWNEVVEMTTSATAIHPPREKTTTMDLMPAIFKSPPPFFQSHPIAISTTLEGYHVSPTTKELFAVIGEPLKWTVKIANMTEQVLECRYRLFILPVHLRGKNPIKVLTTAKSFADAPNLDLKTFLVQGNRNLFQMLIPRSTDVIEYTLIPIKPGRVLLPLFGVGVLVPEELYMYPLLRSVKSLLGGSAERLAAWPRSNVFWSRRAEIFVHTHCSPSGD